MASRLLAHARVHAPWRTAQPRKRVYREVQGVGMWMPWSHRLPDYAAVSPTYGQNLVELAVLLSADSAEPLEVIDVGANIGDSTMQIQTRTPARVLAVEADPYYLDYLHRNVGHRSDVTIAPFLLTTAERPSLQWTPTRRGGTTHFIEGSSQADAQTPTLAVAKLPQQYPALANVRLIKSDTDGYDTKLIVELAATYRATRPVLFFEYDPALTLSVAGGEAAEVWDQLGQLGYDLVGFWSHDGVALAQDGCDRAAETASRLLNSPHGGIDYLDVAVVHSADLIGRGALFTIFSDVTEVGP